MKEDHLYLIQSDKTGMIKIGRSKNPQRRLKTLQTGNPNQLRLIYVYEGKGYLESSVHEELDRWRRKGEWFDYQCVGSIPLYLYDELPFGVLDDWWVRLT